MALFNPRLAGNPLNWVIVGLMVMIGVYAIHIVIGGVQNLEQS